MSLGRELKQTNYIRRLRKVEQLVDEGFTTHQIYLEHDLFDLEELKQIVFSYRRIKRIDKYKRQEREADKV